MKTLGIIGGIAPGSTVDYYRLLIESYQEQTKDGSYPSILINSIDLKRLLDLVGANRLPELTEYLLREIDRLVRAGADFGLMASNTPHIVFEELFSQSPIPLISIVEAACEASQELGLHKVGILGTRFTMAGRFYPEVFARRGITVLVPRSEDQEYVHDKYMRELIPGIFRPETRGAFVGIIKRFKEDGVDGVLLAGTELPLLFRDDSDCGVTLLDTTRIHVARAVTELIS